MPSCAATPAAASFVCLPPTIRIRFATTGNPGWRAWDAKRPVLVFDAPVSCLADAPRDAELASWRRRTGERSRD